MKRKVRRHRRIGGWGQSRRAETGGDRDKACSPEEAYELSEGEAEAR